MQAAMVPTRSDGTMRRSVRGRRYTSGLSELTMVTRRRSRNAVALVTGAARRIGREIALALAGDGWDIGVHYATSRDDALQTVADIEALGRRAIAINRDLNVEGGVRTMLAECAHELGPVSCVVNNASVFEHDDAARFTADTLARAMRTNVAAPVLLAQGLHDQLPADTPGVVINVLDQKLWNPNPDFLSYTLSKAALQQATVLLAMALAPKVRVVGIAPGLTLVSGTQSEQGFARAHASTPLGRSSTPADVAQAAVYLARASAVTGTTLLVDGGQHLVPSGRDVMFLADGEPPPESPA
jgi:NAD(P)-dependent dehydrogenase (short-subunit alcohol dehydrogenase family)